MKYFKKLAFFLALIIPYITLGQADKQVISNFLNAVGGEEVLAKINSFQYKRSYKANAATDYNEEVTIVSNEGKLSRKKSILERDFYYVVNGNSGWVKIPMGSRDKAPTYNVKDLNEKEKSDLLLEVKDGLMPFYGYESKGYKLTSPISVATIEGVLCSKLAIDKTGISREYYFEKESGLLKREVWTINGITHTIDHSEYAETKLGVKLPVESTYINSKDKKKNVVTTEWILENPTQGVSFIK